jgi:phenylalanyl-tRNA synthetase beta chain
MKVTYNWLKEFVEIDIPAAELGKRLTQVGPEVVAITAVGVPATQAEKILPARVADVEKHPKAENLQVLKVSADGDNFQLVTNSPAVEKGDWVVYAAPGTSLPSGITVKEAEIKGVKSGGMLLAREQLRLEEKSSDIWILGKNEKDAKKHFAVYAEEDWVFEIELTANRSDCLSVIGIAREVAAMMDKELRIKKPVVKETLTEEPVIEIEEKNLCPRYSSRILRGVKVQPSDERIQRRLELCGIRSINNIVDATNYVLLESGHPTHAFDFNRLAGGKIVVRGADKGEKLTTLDGKDHVLTDDMLVIADAKSSVALAGVMGGGNSEILDSTKDILLESAFFDPVSIRKTAKALGFRTEASYRFERTADWGVTAAALDRVTELVVESTGALVSKMTDAYVSIFKDRVINVKPEFISSYLGVSLSIKEVEGFLKRLRFPVVARREDVLEVKVPTYRSDVSRPVDIAEEIARIYGYNNIPENMYKPPVDADALAPKRDLKSKLRELFTAQGLSEVYNYSFVSREELEKFGCYHDGVIALSNPLSGDASVLRNRLFPGLLRNMEYNVKSAWKETVRLFEIGRSFERNGKAMQEKPIAGFVIAGPGIDYYHATAIVEWVLKRLGKGVLDFKPSKLGFLHPKNGADLLWNSQPLGFVGEVHPQIVRALELRHPVYLAELDMDTLEAAFAAVLELKPFGKFPPTARDISVTVDDSVVASDLMNAVPAVHEWITSVDFVDVYKGVQVGEGKKSLTFSIVFQSPERTLVDKEVNDTMAKVTDLLKAKFGAVLRG